MKRLTETRKWEDDWFMNLPPNMKLMWQYILDMCDPAGVWEPNFRLASFKIGVDIIKEEAVQAFQGRVIILKDGKWWLPKFIQFQYGKLGQHPKGVQLGVIKILERNGLLKQYAEFVAAEEQSSGDSGEGETGSLALSWSESTGRDTEGIAKSTGIGIGKGKIEEAQPRATKFVAPTLEEVKQYAAGRGNKVNAEVFWQYFENGNPPWTDSQGNRVRAWKQKFVTWENNGWGVSQNGIVPAHSIPRPKN